MVIYTMKFNIFSIAVPIYIVSNFSPAVNGKDDSRIKYDDDDSDVKDNVRFFLYTRKNKNRPVQIFINDTNGLKKTDYDVSLPTKFVAHGWNSSYKSDSSATVVQALLTHDDYNVIAIDWETIASQNYSKSVSKVRVTGKYVGEMIAFLEDQGAILAHMSLIGHSMGAHVVGFAGKNLPERVTEKVGHIVGLDPAGRGGLESQGPNDRLSRDDAENVQVIHTNMGQLGMSVYVGYSDFYPNGGGPKQPGCPDDDEGHCAHLRSYEYYAEALRNPKSWYGIECDSFDDFNNGKCKQNEIKPFPRWSGDFKAKRVKYMLRTNSKSPYGLGRNGTQPAN